MRRYNQQDQTNIVPKKQSEKLKVIILVSVKHFIIRFFKILLSLGPNESSIEDLDCCTNRRKRGTAIKRCKPCKPTDSGELDPKKPRPEIDVQRDKRLKETREQKNKFQNTLSQLNKVKPIDKNLNPDKIYEQLGDDGKKILKNNFQSFGGSYKQGDDIFYGRKGLYEVNHTPPKSAYKDTPYSKIKPDDMPTALMEYGDHRKYLTTGSGNDEKELTNRVLKCNILNLITSTC